MKNKKIECPNCGEKIQLCSNKKNKTKSKIGDLKRDTTKGGAIAK